MLDSNKNNVQRRTFNQPVKTKAFHTAVNEKQSSHNPIRAMCNGTHLLYHCLQFKKLPVIEKQNVAQTKIMCFDCPAPTHPVYKCRPTTSCPKCGRKHHTLLHFEKNDRETYNNLRQNESKEYQKGDTTSGKGNTVVANFSRGDLKPHVLLATAIVKSNSKTIPIS